MKRVLLVLCLSLSGCASTFELDKQTLIVFSIGPTLTVLRTVDIEAEAKAGGANGQ